ncbi:hypothetical protein AAXB25_22755 [Paenibacillus lautus]|uniref:hypothetical protein n=1 Tax=Paenibacillus lautus TaxID=1401 RepID=UPI003D2DBDE8
MGWKDLFFRGIKKEQSVDVTKKSLLQKIESVIDEIRTDYYTHDSIQIELNDELPINQGEARFNNNQYIVVIGVQGCSEKKDLLDSEWITLKNTIVHELTHIKNRVQMSKDTQEKIKASIRSLPHFAMNLIDEYSAYKAADDKFKQFKMMSEEIDVQKAHGSFWLGKNVTRLSAETRYSYYYDNCTAVIVHSFRNKNFPSIPEMYAGYNNMCRDLVGILSEYNSKMPLNYDEYERAGKEIWGALLKMVPVENQQEFKENVGIKWA